MGIILGIVIWAILLWIGVSFFKWSIRKFKNDMQKAKDKTRG